MLSNDLTMQQPMHSPLSDRISTLEPSGKTNSPAYETSNRPPADVIPAIAPTRDGSSAGSDRNYYYPGDPLPGNDYIRLLQVPSAEEHKPSITWQKVRLEEAPPYFALSYTWGSPSTDSRFSRTGKITLTGNLWSTLLRIMAVAPGYWWIDAQCIN
jgi:Heterokaryon incompatibility protein (HET)